MILRISIKLIFFRKVSAEDGYEGGLTGQGERVHPDHGHSGK